jgi:hypothetical protein
MQWLAQPVGQRCPGLLPAIVFLAASASASEVSALRVIIAVEHLE